MKKITLLLLLLISISSVAQTTKLSDYEGKWNQEVEEYDDADELTLSVVNNKISVKMNAYGSCPYIFKYKNAKYSNGIIKATRVQYDSGGDTSESKVNFVIKDKKLYITDLAQYGCGAKTTIFLKKANPIDEIIGVYKMDDKDYSEHMTAIIGNYGKYIEISKNGNSITVREYDLNNSSKDYIKHKNYKYDSETNTISGINYMQDEYNKSEKKYKLSFKDNKLIRNQEWWGFPDNLILNYIKI